MIPDHSGVSQQCLWIKVPVYSAVYVMVYCKTAGYPVRILLKNKWSEPSIFSNYSKLNIRLMGQTKTPREKAIMLLIYNTEMAQR